MNPFTYYHGITFPDSIEKKINKLTSDGYLTKVSHTETQNCFHTDHFYSDGTPVVFDPNTIFPCYAAHYLGVPIPESLLAVPESYCTHAAIAAYKWLEKITMGGYVDLTHFDGESFTAQINGKEVHFTFPDTVFHMMHHNPRAAGTKTTPTHFARPYAVIPWPDVSDNNEDWHNGSIPYYAEVQAHLLLWCWWYSTDVLKRHTECPVDCYIVRITGNTPGDITVRVVHSNPPKQDALVKQIAKRLVSNPIADNSKIRMQGTWFERKQSEQENAYRVEDPNTYKLVRNYMAAKTTRMTLEAQSDALKEQMDALAVKLACLTAADSRAGTVVDVTPTGMGKVMYKVTHTPKMSRPSHAVSADLVQQFFPEYSDCITVIEKPRGSVTIEAM